MTIEDDWEVYQEALVIVEELWGSEQGTMPGDLLEANMKIVELYDRFLFFNRGEPCGD